MLAVCLFRQSSPFTIMIPKDSRYLPFIDDTGCLKIDGTKLLWQGFITEATTMVVIWNMSNKKCTLWARDIKSMLFFFTQNIFLSCPRHCDRGLIVDIVYYFQIWNKKEYKIIISRVINSHMGSMCIETPYIIWFGFFF